MEAGGGPVRFEDRGALQKMDASAHGSARGGGESLVAPTLQAPTDRPVSASVRVGRAAYYLILVVACATTIYYLWALQHTRSPSTKHGFQVDYLMKRAHGQGSDLLELLVGWQKDDLGREVSPRRFAVRLAPPYAVDEPISVYFIIDGDPTCFRSDHRRLTALTHLPAGGKLYNVVLPKLTGIECDYDDMDLAEDFVHRSFNVRWASDMFNWPRGVDNTGYQWPHRMLIFTDFEDEEDYHVSHVSQAMVGSAQLDMAAVPMDSFTVSWTDAGAERQRDIALLVVGAFLGLIVTVAVEITKKYA